MLFRWLRIIYKAIFNMLFTLHSYKKLNSTYYNLQNYTKKESVGRYGQKMHSAQNNRKFAKRKRNERNYRIVKAFTCIKKYNFSIAVFTFKKKFNRKDAKRKRKERN